MVTDVSGNELKVGTLVAFNRSGEVHLGHIVEIGFDQKKSDRDKDYRYYNKMDYYTFKVEPLNGRMSVRAGGMVKKVSNVTKRQNLHSIENVEYCE